MLINKIVSFLSSMQISSFSFQSFYVKQAYQADMFKNVLPAMNFLNTLKWL